MNNPFWNEPTTTKDWPEDFDKRNGNYMNTCYKCKESFRGYKRRIVCKECSDEG